MLTTFTVTSLSDVSADDGETTLREAVAQAEASAGLDRIEFESGLSGVITLTQGRLDITGHHIEVIGNGREQTVIDGSNADFVFFLSDNDDSAGLFLRGLTLRNATRQKISTYVSNYSDGNIVSLDDVLVTGSGSGVGAGSTRTDAGERDSLVIRNSSIVENGDGGVGAVGGADVTIEDSDISGNTGTGLFISGYSENSGEPDVTVLRTVIDGNQSGGIRHHYGKVLVEDSRISNNTGTKGAGILTEADRFRDLSLIHI